MSVAFVLDGLSGGFRGGLMVDVGGKAASGLETWRAPLLDVLGRKTRRTWAPLYLQALLGPGERRSLQPMAARLGLPRYDQLHHFIASTAWDDARLWTVQAQAQEANRLVDGPDAASQLRRTGVIDDTALSKQGALSIGVALQYCGRLSKRANCQALVSLTLGQGKVPVPVALRLFLPEGAARCRGGPGRAGGDVLQAP